MYLKKEHFNRILENNGYSPDLFDNHERLSSGAYMYSTGTDIFIIYQSTLVFKKHNGQIELNTNGWETVTSKKWINYGLSLAGKGAFIYQKDYKWYLDNSTRHTTTPYVDYMQLMA